MKIKDHVLLRVLNIEIESKFKAHFESKGWSVMKGEQMKNLLEVPNIYKYYFSI